MEVITILCPYCEIDNCATTICFCYDESGKKPVFNGVIRGYYDSTAEDYAYINDYRFDSLGKAPETEPLLLLCIAIRLSEKS